MIRIGTRTSKLAMIQTELVKQKIQEYFPKEKIEIVPIITKGDIILHQPLASFGGKGVFTQEIEQQLLDKTIDIAVHSAKDVPMQLADGLCIGAVLAREDCRDVLDDDYVTDDLIHYIRPLIQAELSPIMVDGLPRHLNVNF